MASLINKKTLKHLAELARIELNAREEERLTKDLQKILDYFKELQSLDTTGIEPVSGGTALKNIFRDDMSSESTNHAKGKKDFPDERDGFLSVPAVFDDNG